MSGEARWGADVVVGGDAMTSYAFTAMCRALSELYPDARVTGAPQGLFAITLGKMTDDLPEWME